MNIQNELIHQSLQVISNSCVMRVFIDTDIGIDNRLPWLDTSNINELLVFSESSVLFSTSTQISVYWRPHIVRKGNLPNTSNTERHILYANNFDCICLDLLISIPLSILFGDHFEIKTSYFIDYLFMAIMWQYFQRLLNSILELQLSPVLVYTSHHLLLLLEIGLQIQVFIFLTTMDSITQTR